MMVVFVSNCAHTVQVIYGSVVLRTCVHSVCHCIAVLWMPN